MDMHTGELPITKFVDLNDGMEVDILFASNPRKIRKAMAEMVHATFQNRAWIYPDHTRSFEELQSGGSGWALAEMPTLIVRVRQCSRIFTHQLVRQRIGITYMQQCTGDQDMRHADVLIPLGCLQHANPAIVPIFTQQALDAKQAYANLLDADVPVHAARYLLPHGIATYIYFSCTLSTAVALYRNRICPMVQTWETHLFAKRLREAVGRSFGEYLYLFENPCEKKACIWYRIKGTGGSTDYWKADETHAPGPPSIHPLTNREFNTPIHPIS